MKYINEDNDHSGAKRFIVTMSANDRASELTPFSAEYGAVPGIASCGIQCSEEFQMLLWQGEGDTLTLLRVLCDD